MSEIFRDNLDRALSGEEGAFAELARPYFGPLYGFVFLMVRDRDMAEDVVQETLIKAWRHLGRYDRIQSWKTWLYTIAKRTALDALKKKRALPFTSFRDEDGSLPFEPELAIEPEITALLNREDATDKLDRALALLSPLYRTLLVLVYREDCSLEETAEILEEPYNTIKSRHIRALGKLRDAYQSLDASVE
jgi:RNA polymerase sigma-70 factor (ECF subfamily)